MGTRGYVVLKYNGIYYIFYNNSDSYLSHLGKNVLNNLKEIIQNNQLPIVKLLFCKIEEQSEFNGDGSNHFYSIMDSIRYPTSLQYMTSKDKPECTLFIEWIYTVDFDKNLFIIQNYDKYYQVGFYNLPDSIDENKLVSITCQNNKKDKENNQEENSDKKSNEIDESDDDTGEDIKLSDDDTDEDIKLKIKILEMNVKIYKMKLKLIKDRK